MDQEKPAREETERQNSAKLLGGRIACVVGILLSAGGILAAFLGAGVSISAGVVGVLLGVVGYSLGSRRLGGATVVLGVMAIFLVAALTKDLWA